MSQCPLGRHGSAGAGTQADGHIGHIHVRHGAQEFPPVGGHAAHQVGVVAGHHVGAAFGGQPQGVLAGGLEVVAVFHQVHAQCAHGRVLLHRIAVRHDDGAGHAMASRGPADALAVVAARGADDLVRQLTPLRQLVEVRQAAADLERAHRVVVLVLEPALRAEALAQQAPAVLRRGLELLVDGACRGFDVGQRGQRCCGARHSRASPRTQVTEWPPTQICGPSCCTCTRPARPSAVPWLAT